MATIESWRTKNGKKPRWNRGTQEIEKRMDKKELSDIPTDRLVTQKKICQYCKK